MTVKGLRSLQRDLERISDDLMDEVDDAVSDTFDYTERRAKSRIVREDAVHTRSTYRGFVQGKVVDGKTTRRWLTNETPHAKFVEWGTGDQFGTSSFRDLPSQRYDAPDMSTRLIGSLERWIEQKPSFRRQGRPPRNAAIPIALTISGNVDDEPSGTPPQPFMRPAWQRGRRKLDSKIQAAVRKVVR